MPRAGSADERRSIYVWIMDRITDQHRAEETAAPAETQTLQGLVFSSAASED